MDTFNILTPTPPLLGELRMMDLIVPNVMCRRVELLQQLFSEEVCLICSISLSVRRLSDRRMWHYD